jgi:hypothetical protein
LFEILFPAVLGALLWGGLALRDDRLRNTHSSAQLMITA